MGLSALSHKNGEKGQNERRMASGNKVVNWF
jgi:hypothetical protein